jgi:hypothetical protein
MTTLVALPLSYQQKLNTRYDGLPAAVFDSSSEYHNFTAALKQAGVSFLTKITKQKRRQGKARKFVVMVVDPPGHAT